MTLNIACAQKQIVSNPDITEEAKSLGQYDIEWVVNELEIPWGMAFLPNGDMLITEKSGEIIRFSNGEKYNIEGVPEVYLRGQGGLLDIELHPQYADNGWIYLTYSTKDGGGEGGNTTLVRVQIKDDEITVLEKLYKAVPNTKKPVHFGSRIEFDNDGYLFFSIGDRYNRDVNPQDVTKDGGKIYRLKDDGSIPEDNPFVSQADAKHAVYSYGHRNPQGMVLHPETGDIWVHEHGPRGGDEINIIKPGVNYGWPKASYGINYSGTIITDDKTLPGMENSIFHWIPSIAPSGMCFVTSDKYPKWKGNLLVGSLVFKYLERLELDGEKVTFREKLLTDLGRIRNVRQAPDGYIYVAVEGKGICKIVPKS